MYYQTDFLTTLAYLMGERSVNSTTSAPRADFIQMSLNDAYKAYPWRFARANATLTVTDGVATLPTVYDDNHLAYAKFDNGGVVENLTSIDPDDENTVVDGDLATWIEALDDGMTYILKTKDTNVSTVRFRYQKKAPTLATASVGTPYFNKRTIALGARRDVKLGQNPDADISQDQAIFERELAKDFAAHQVEAPRKKRRTLANRTGDF